MKIPSGITKNSFFTDRNKGNGAELQKFLDSNDYLDLDNVYLGIDIDNASNAEVLLVGGFSYKTGKIEVVSITVAEINRLYERERVQLLAERDKLIKEKIANYSKHLNAFTPNSKWWVPLTERIRQKEHDIKMDFLDKQHSPYEKVIEKIINSFKKLVCATEEVEPLKAVDEVKSVPHTSKSPKP